MDKDSKGLLTWLSSIPYAIKASTLAFAIVLALLGASAIAVKANPGFGAVPEISEKASFDEPLELKPYMVKPGTANILSIQLAVGSFKEPVKKVATA